MGRGVGGVRARKVTVFPAIFPAFAPEMLNSDMTLRMIRTGVCVALAAALLTLAPASAPDAWGEPKAKKAKTVAKPAKPKASIEKYQRAKAAYEKQLDAYWDDIAAKRRIRIAKRRDKQQVVLEDYVLTQPPVYSGPPRPAGAA